MTVSLTSLERQALALQEGASRGAKYLRQLSSRHVQAKTTGLYALDFDLPTTGQPVESILDLMEIIGSEGTMASAAGRYFGYVVGGALPAPSAARAMLTGWDQIADKPTGPSVVQMETVAVRWVKELLRLPKETQGAFTTGATIANASLLITARDVLLERLGHRRERGLIGAPDIRIVASAEIHATVLKSLRMIGLGSDKIEFVPVDDQGRMIPSAIPILDDRTLVLAQAGNVCSGAMDPVAEIADLCEPAGAWLHIDGAFGLWTRVSKQMGHNLDGLERADSWVVDAHKTLNAPYDSGIALCRHPDTMRESMAIGASYLPPSEPGPSDLAMEFSRSARGAETYAALLSLGQNGLVDMIDRFHALAKKVKFGVERIGFQVPHDVHFNQVFVTLPEDEALCSAIIHEVQNSGEAWFGAAAWQGRSGFRISVSNWATTEEDVDRLLAVLEKALVRARQKTS
ncbi:Glutamate or tyrosine decarboxylase [Cohaesibacter marisflavi]|uniref:Glutamate or tyrosine decarboxylase n=1 Tax=Cohaesibacter marisflavi TaxID=655353 RepID=A0A1I4Z9T5_9HYPH|nr:aminotransferase class V-fold PLP-dependent enzyme [Cohaesibacter marisflavi]SFN47054.1 Glutamate or tyrosine decarboxylase [Cohaesibacter marisflavi]